MNRRGTKTLVLWALLATSACSSPHLGISEACTADSECLTSLCVQGACRLPCSTDCDCADDSTCTSSNGRFACVQGAHACVIPRDAGPVVRDTGPRFDANHVGQISCGVGYAGDNPRACDCYSSDFGDSTPCSQSSSGQGCCADPGWPLVATTCECGTPACHHHDFGDFDRCDCDWNNASGGTVVSSCSPQPGAVCCASARNCRCQSDFTFCDPMLGWDRQVARCDTTQIQCEGTHPTSCR